MYATYGIHLLQKAPDAWLKALNPQVVVYGAAWENQSADTLEKFRDYARHLVTLLPRAVIGVRWWPDDNILLRMSPEVFASAFFKLHVPGTILMVGNEDASSASNPAVYQNTVALHTRVVQLATDAGIPVGTCCTAVGNPEYGQYKLLQPLFNAMADGRRRGIVHWWRPNAYAPLPFDQGEYRDLIARHIREARKLGNFPPTFYGEFNFVKNIQDSLSGPNSFGVTPTQWVEGLRAAALDIPEAIYCYGDGIYDSRWKEFNVGRNQGFMDAMVNNLPRVPYTAYEGWQLSKVDPVTTPTITSEVKSRVANVGVRMRSSPSTSGAIVRALVMGETVTLYTTAQNYVADGYTWRYFKDSAGVLGWAAETINGKETFSSPVANLPIKLLNPLRKPVLLSGKFGTPRVYPNYSKPMRHEGLDLVPATSECTTFIYPAADGTVEKINYNVTGYGNYLVLDHGNGWKTWYCHLKYPPFVCEIGQKVSTSDIIGVMGTTGNSTGPHLHLTVQHIGFGITSPEYVLPDVVDPEPLIEGL